MIETLVNSGLWPVPVLLLVAGLLFFVLAVISYLSGTNTGKGRVPLYKLGYFWFAVALFVLAGAAVWKILFDYGYNFPG